MALKGTVLDGIVLDPKEHYDRYPTVEDLVADDWEIAYVRVVHTRKVKLKIRKNEEEYD